MKLLIVLLVVLNLLLVSKLVFSNPTKVTKSITPKCLTMIQSSSESKSNDTSKNQDRFAADHCLCSLCGEYLGEKEFHYCRQCRQCLNNPPKEPQKIVGLWNCYCKACNTFYEKYNCDDCFCELRS